MAITSPGRYLIEHALPEKYRNFAGALDGKQVKKLFTQMAKELDPDEYRTCLKKLNNIGNTIATEYGGVASIHLSDLKLPDNLNQLREDLKAQVNAIQQRRDLTSAEKKQQITAVVREATPIIDKAVVETLGKQENSFGLQVATGVRGKPQQLRQLVIGDLLSLDSKMREIPVPTLRSYGEGVTPLQYWVASHGGRKGYIDVQKATADAGYFAKQVRSAAHRQIITNTDCGKARPYTVDTDDDNNIGSLLYADTKGKSGKVYPADTVLTANILDDLPDRIKIRSAITCGQHEGVCAKCSGVRETNKLPTMGESVGMNAVNSFLEGLTQSGLCLYADTEVRMADLSTKRIVDIKPGDLVLAADKTGKTFPTPVVALHNNGEQRLYKFSAQLNAGSEHCSIICTKNHKCLLSEEKYNVDAAIIRAIHADYKKTYLLVKSRLNSDVLQQAEVTKMLDRGVHTAYDIEINTPDHLFVLANGMIVSNSSKHGGGEAVSARRIKHGLDAVDQFINMPEEFVGGATVSESDGLVTGFREAPQGGTLVAVGDKEYHVPADATITVKKGDYIEAGDLLCDGMPNMRTIVKHKGIGEGRRLFVNALNDVLKAANSDVIRKNVETFARAYVNKVRITDPDGVQGWLIDDLADYNALAANWKPRETAYTVKTPSSIGKYLEVPTLHYSIGTRITKRVADTLMKEGIATVDVNDEPAPFEPAMVSAKQFAAVDDDFLTALSGENLMRSIEQHTQHGADTEKESTSYYPRITFMSGGGSNAIRVS